MSFSYHAGLYPYPSRREVVYGRKGMVCTSQHLAAQAGLDVLKQGGNAVDAALATDQRQRSVSGAADQRPRHSRRVRRNAAAGLASGHGTGRPGGVGGNP